MLMGTVNGRSRLADAAFDAAVVAVFGLHLRRLLGVAAVHGVSRHAHRGAVLRRKGQRLQRARKEHHERHQANQPCETASSHICIM